MSNSQAPARSHLLQRVMLRREGQVLHDVSTRLLVPGIRNGQLRRTDEFSGDGVHWIKLGTHRQLAPLFDAPDSRPAGFPEKNVVCFFDDENTTESYQPPPHIEEELGRLAEMLREINT